MGNSIRAVLVSSLLLDQSNARLGEEQLTQQATQIALAKLVGDQLVRIAKDIVENGLDPTTLIAITTDGAPSGRFRVIEGNRRVLALKSLETPGIVDRALTSSNKKRLADLSSQYRLQPIARVQCVVFDSEDEAHHWITLRHTGANSGVGLVEWDANEQDRYKNRHEGTGDRSTAGQVIDFVDLIMPPKPGDKRIFTTLQRLINTPTVRERLGIEFRDGQVVTPFPGHEVVKGLKKMITDLRSGRIKVTDVYYENERQNYIADFSLKDLPNPSTMQGQSVPISSLSPAVPTASSGSSFVSAGSSSATRPISSQDDREAGNGRQSASNATQGSADTPTADATSGRLTRPSRVKVPKKRRSTIPKDCVLWITTPRINAIYHELIRLDVEDFTNACAVLLRVFVELSVDHHIAVRKLLTDEQRRSMPLAKRLKELASDLKAQGEIGDSLEKAVIKIADGVGMFSASTTTFNQYVHNQYAFPQIEDLRTAWDELQPLMQVLWKK